MKKYLSVLTVLAVILVAGCHCEKEKTINFAFDSYELTAQDKAELDKVVKKMKTTNMDKVEIYGYTDATGNADYNMQLSRERAMEAARYLKAQGISSDRITLRAFGQNDPIASNKTALGRMENRRVDLTIYN